MATEDPGSVPGLIQQLRHRDVRVRLPAVEALARRGGAASEAVPALLVACCDGDPAVRRATLSALAQIDQNWPAHPRAGDAVPALVKELRSRSPEIMQTASGLLVRLGGAAVSELTRILSEGTSDTQHVYAAQTLGRIGPAAAPAVPALTQALTSEYTHVRLAAAEALAALGEAAAPAIPVFVVLLSDWSADLRRVAANTLARIQCPVDLAGPVLLQMLADRDDGVREAAVHALTQAGVVVVPLLVESLQYLDSHEMRDWLGQKVQAVTWYANAVERLAQGGMIQIGYRQGDPQVEALRREPLKALRNRGWFFQQAVEDQLLMETAREAVLRILGQIGPAAAAGVPWLQAALADGNRRIRLAAARSLGQIGPAARSASSALVPLLVDPSEPVRKVALESLTALRSDWAQALECQGFVENLIERLGRGGTEAQQAGEVLVRIGASVVPLLIRALNVTDRLVREGAATVLGRIGPAAEAAIPALVGALKDGSGWVREAAAAALEKVDPDGSRRQAQA
jgi:HEAT repeat protein